MSINMTVFTEIQSMQLPSAQEVLPAVTTSRTSFNHNYCYTPVKVTHAHYQIFIDVIVSSVHNVTIPIKHFLALSTSIVVVTDRKNSFLMPRNIFLMQRD